MLKPIIFIEKNKRLSLADNFKRRKSYEIFMHPDLRPIEGETVTDDYNKLYRVQETMWVPEKPVSESSDCCLMVTLKRCKL